MRLFWLNFINSSLSQSRKKKEELVVRIFIFIIANNRKRNEHNCGFAQNSSHIPERKNRINLACVYT